jgi:hypothetical protein
MNHFKLFILKKFYNPIKTARKPDEICETHIYKTNTPIVLTKPIEFTNEISQISSVLSLCPFPPKRTKKHLLNSKKLCEIYLKNPLTEDQKKKMWEKVTNILIKEGFPKDFKEIKVDLLLKMFDAFDTVYWGGKLKSSLCSTGDAIIFTVNKRLITTAGRASMSGIKICKSVDSLDNTFQYKIEMSYKIFNNLFTENELNYTSNGSLCNNRLECFQNVFAHEMTHLINFRYCELLDIDMENVTIVKLTGASKRMKGHRHDDIFNTLAYNMFGFTKFKHSLLSNKSSTQIIDQILKLTNQLKRNMIVKILVNDISNSPINVKILGISKKFNNILIEYNGKKWKNVSVTDIIEIPILGYKK